MRHFRLMAPAAVVLLLAGLAARGGLADAEKTEPDVLFVATPPDVVAKMLELAGVTNDDVVYDLGCGDGRIVLTAARKYKCRAVGVDIDPQRIKECEANKAKENKEVQNRVTFVKENLFKTDLSKATVVALYLLPELNAKLVPQLAKMKKGARIVSHAFVIPGYREDKQVEYKGPDDTVYDLFVYTTPLKPEKKPADKGKPKKVPAAKDKPKDK
jgi:precorrin-6B methylase 2